MTALYDENAMRERLARLDRHAKTAFAAACAQRLLPFFERYARTEGLLDQLPKLAAVVAAAWKAAAGDAIDGERYKAEAEALVPDADDSAISDGAYAQNAAAAAAYAIRAWLTDDAQEAALAGRQLYELADQAVLRARRDLDLNAPGFEAQVLNSPMVQRAYHELDEILAQVEAGPPTWDSLLIEATLSGRDWDGRVFI